MELVACHAFERHVWIAWTLLNLFARFVSSKLQEEHVSHKCIGVIKRVVKHVHRMCGIVPDNEGTELVITYAVGGFVGMCHPLFQYPLVWATDLSASYRYRSWQL